MDEGRKRVIGIMAAILASLHMQTADDLFGTPQGSPRTDKLIDASIQWAERIMRRIDTRSLDSLRLTVYNFGLVEPYMKRIERFVNVPVLVSGHVFTPNCVQNTDYAMK